MLQPSYGALRTALIAYGTAAFALLFNRFFSSGAEDASAASKYFLAGIVLQLTLCAAHAIIKRQSWSRGSEQQTLLILELIADGATVALFALGTFEAIAGMMSSL